MAQRLTLRDYWNIFIEDLPALALMIAGLFTVVWSVASRDWIGGLGSLFFVLTVSLIICYLLTLSEMSDLFALAYASFFAVVTVWWVAARSIRAETTGGLRERLMTVGERVGAWIGEVIGGGIPDDNLIFFVVLGLIVWYLGFSAMWNLFRTHRLWQATIPPGLALLIVVYYEPTNTAIENYLLLYLFLIFLLAAYTNLLNREALWAREGVPISKDTRKVVMRAGVLMICVLLLSAWLAPTVQANERLQDWWTDDDAPWSRVQDEVDRVFGSADDAPATVPDYYGGSTLSMGGPVELSNREVMHISAPFGYRYYWQSKAFDTYSNGQWRADPDIRIKTPFGNLREEQPQPYFARIPLQQQVEIQIPATELLYAAPMPDSFAAMGIASEVILTSDTEDYGTLTLVRAQRVIEQGESYEATSMFSIADAQALRNAGSAYPLWVRETYLTLPNNITPRTVDLAELLASGTSNPYDTALAMENYLRTTITYNESVPAPPPGVEPVDYTLFERPEGYCNYYASSMAVMLRSVGIPARVVAGFSQGEFDVEQEVYVVREANAHTWVEVYFPNYGWIQFEPTAAESPIFRREGDDNLTPTPTPNQQAPNVPQADGTPTPTPEPEAPQPDTPEATIGSSGLPFFSRAVLSVLRVVWWGSLALIVGGGGLLMLWFWFEQRGMGELSDVSRSYARMNAYAGLTGILPDRSHTPYERARQIIDAIPEIEQPVYSIVRMYVEEQYNPNAHMTRDRLMLRQKAQNAWRKARVTFLREALQRRAKRLLGRD